MEPYRSCYIEINLKELSYLLTCTFRHEDAEHNFNFREDSKGSDVLITTKSHPSGMVDYTAMIIKYLKKYGIIPRAATNVVVTDQNTYGIRK